MPWWVWLVLGEAHQVGSGQSLDWLGNTGETSPVPSQGAW